MDCKFRHVFALVLLAVVVLMSSCSKLIATKVTYRSVRTTFAQPDKEHPIPEEAEIVVAYAISDEGKLNAVVFNRTDEIMIIDQTKSFFVNSDGQSTMYYDPTVRAISTTNTQSNTSGGSVNLGSVAGFVGVGGPVGGLLRGVNVGGATTNGVSTTEVVRIADMPEVSLSPHSHAAMSKSFSITGMSADRYLEGTAIDLDYKNTYCKFSVCISYSLDGGKNFKKIISNFYANSKIVVPVSNSKNVNEALRTIYTKKPDAIYEPFWRIDFHTNFYGHDYNPNCIHGVLYDFQ